MIPIRRLQVGGALPACGRCQCRPVSRVPDKLEKTFEMMRAKFFPRWDRARRWRCRRMTAQHQHHGDGLCVPATRTIYITRKIARWTRPQRLGVIIHELCHAVRSRSGHSLPWQKRMILAAKRAAATGDPVLGQWLRQEVRRYQTPATRLTAKSTYREIRAFVEESGIVPTFEAMVEEFSRSRLMTPGQFLRRYPRARETYAAGIRAARNRSSQKKTPIA